MITGGLGPTEWWWTPPCPHRVECKQNAAAVLRSGVLVELLPHISLAAVGATLITHGKTVVQEESVGFFLVIGQGSFLEKKAEYSSLPLQACQ